MSIQELINNINNAFCEFERYIKVILNINQNYYIGKEKLNDL